MSGVTRIPSKAAPRLLVKPMNISATLLRTPGFDQSQAIFEWMLLVRGLIHALGLGIFFLSNLDGTIIHNLQKCKGQADGEILLAEQ